MIFPGFLLALTLIGPHRPPTPPAVALMFGQDFVAFETVLGQPTAVQREGSTETRLYPIGGNGSVSLTKEEETTMFATLVRPCAPFVNCAFFSWRHGIYQDWQGAVRSIGLDPAVMKAVWFYDGRDVDPREGARLSGAKGVRSVRWVPRDPDAAGNDTLQVFLTARPIQNA